MYSFKRPNVLIIYTDQQRLDTLSCTGLQNAIQTKNIDALARDGMLFTNCFTQSPICGPSRMSFLSGRYCSSVGVGSNGIEFPYDSVTPVNKILKDYGYETAQIGKIHFLPHAKRDAKDMYRNCGFDRFIISDEPGCYDDAYTKWVEIVSNEDINKVRTALPPAAYAYGKKEYSTVPRNTHEPYVFEGKDEVTHSAFVASETCRFLNERDKNKPFFAIAGFYAPHPPINPPKSCIERVDISKIKLPVLDKNKFLMPELKNIPQNKWIEIIQYYLALTLHVDDCVGDIIKTLKEIEEYENTIIIFTSDHGEYLGDHGKIQKGMPGYDCITNVPLIINYPKKIKKSLVYTNIVESVDVIPTILDLCGVQIIPQMQGKSLTDVINNPNIIHKDSALTENFEPYGLKESCIRTDKYRYYCNNKGEELLFDILKDKKETIDVSKKAGYQDIISDMRKKMIVKMQNASYQNLDKQAEY